MARPLLIVRNLVTRFRTALISVVIGTLTGFLGGRFDMVIQRIVDAYMSFPQLVILIAVVSVVRPGMFQIIGVLSLVFGIGGSRIIRSAVISVREKKCICRAMAGPGTRPVFDRSGLVYATNVFGDALRDLLDPRMRGSK